MKQVILLTLYLINLLIVFPIHIRTQIIVTVSYSPIDSDVYSLGSRFAVNLNFLLSSLVFNTSTPSLNGFYNTSIGDAPDIVYGLAQCRGDKTMAFCRSCLNSAKNEIVQRFPKKSTAIIRYGSCIIRYSNVPFFSVVEYKSLSYSKLDATNITDVIKLKKFHSVLGDLLSNLTEEASHSPSMFKTGQARYADFDTVYALAECTRDLTRAGCLSCLATLKYNTGRSFASENRGTIATGSCVIRFAEWLFYEDNAPPPVPVIGVAGSTPLVKKGSRSNFSKTIVIVAFSALIATVVFLLFTLCAILQSKRKRSERIMSDSMNEITSSESLQFDFQKIRTSTHNFSDANTIGKGGFGKVYKGVLVGGLEIAVKRLSQTSEQGLREFENEVELLHKLQHRNLVRLLGFSFEGEEKLLIYEYIPNGSLDNYLFGPKKEVNLKWERRFNIIGGIARGLLYLHQDSRLKIIHLDLKASNILVDKEMEPKISDFGMAKLFVLDQSHIDATRIAGTFGYMAPEYQLSGIVSAKADVFSFGVLLLEIISGQKVHSFIHSNDPQNLLVFAWKLWGEDNPLELMDPVLYNMYSENEVMKCIHIGLLCVQENVDDRPTMLDVVSMLNSHAYSLPSPSPPPGVGHNILLSLSKISSSKTNSCRSQTTSLSSSGSEPRIPSPNLNFDLSKSSNYSLHHSA